MNETIYQGETLEDALDKAGEAMGVAPAALEYKVEEEKSGGFWGLDETYVRLRAWVRTEEDTAMVGEEEDAAMVGEEEDAAMGGEEEEEPTNKEEEETEPSPPEEAAEEVPEEVPEEAAPSHDEPDKAQPRGFWGAPDGSAVAGEEETPAEAEAEAIAEDEPKDTERPDDDAGVVAEEPLAQDSAPVEEPQHVPATTPGHLEGDEAETSPAADMDSDAGPEIEELIKKILVGMDFDCTVSVQGEGEVYMAMVGGPDKELLLEGNGRPLSALELILNHAFRHRLTERRKIRVDAGDFRSRREDELRDLAFQVAHSAKETARTQETQPLNPYERRLVHLALAEDSEVTTRSRGSGFLKNVQVIPRRGGRGNR